MKYFKIRVHTEDDVYIVKAKNRDDAIERHGAGEGELLYSYMPEQSEVSVAPMPMEELKNWLKGRKHEGD